MVSVWLWPSVSKRVGAHVLNLPPFPGPCFFFFFFFFCVFQDKHPDINVGDCFVEVNGHNVVGCRHFEVARMLKEAVIGSALKLKLIEPKASFSPSSTPTPARAADSDRQAKLERLRQARQERKKNKSEQPQEHAKQPKVSH